MLFLRTLLMFVFVFSLVGFSGSYAKSLNQNNISMYEILNSYGHSEYRLIKKLKEEISCSNFYYLLKRRNYSYLNRLKTKHQKILAHYEKKCIYPSKLYEIGIYHLKNENYDNAISYLKKSCSSKKNIGCEFLTPENLYKYSINSFIKRNYDATYLLSLKSCESNLSIGCELLATIIDGRYSWSEQRKNKKIKHHERRKVLILPYLKKGHKSGDDKSTAMLFDFYNGPFLSVVSDSKKAEELFNYLKTKNSVPAKARIKLNCFSQRRNNPFKSIFSNCSVNTCKWAHEELKNPKKYDIATYRTIRKVAIDDICLKANNTKLFSEYYKSLDNPFNTEYKFKNFYKKFVFDIDEKKINTIIASNQTKDPSQRPYTKNFVKFLSELSDKKLCDKSYLTGRALHSKGGGFKNFQLNFELMEFLRSQELEKRNLDCKSLHTREWTNDYVCMMLDVNMKFVNEAKRRGLDCGLSNNKTIIASKPKNTKPSISSAELEKERAKILEEEERKRKALEQRIAELEKKNKELQKPKKKQPPKSRGGSGSGFFISKLGHIITNEHVVKKCNKITVGDNIDRQVPARLIEVDRKNDLALLRTTTLDLASSETKSLIKKLSTQKLGIEIVPLATAGLMRSDDVELGEDIVVAGFPYGDIFSKDIKVTFGNVNSTKGVGDDSSQFQIQAPVQIGNSGGPIYDKYGNIVGVVVAQLDKLKMAKTIGSLPENVNFGIKASTVKQFLNSSGLPTKWAERNKEMSNKEISQIASKQTVMVVCHR